MSIQKYYKRQRSVQDRLMSQMRGRHGDLSRRADVRAEGKMGSQRVFQPKGSSARTQGLEYLRVFEKTEAFCSLVQVVHKKLWYSGMVLEK